MERSPGWVQRERVPGQWTEALRRRQAQQLVLSESQFKRLLQEWGNCQIAGELLSSAFLNTFRKLLTLAL